MCAHNAIAKLHAFMNKNTVYGVRVLGEKVFAGNDGYSINMGNEKEGPCEVFDG